MKQLLLHQMKKTKKQKQLSGIIHHRNSPKKLYVFVDLHVYDPCTKCAGICTVSRFAKISSYISHFIDVHNFTDKWQLMIIMVDYKREMKGSKRGIKRRINEQRERNSLSSIYLPIHIFFI